MLQNDGELTENSVYNKSENATCNSWNIVLRFTWWFAPGSQLTLLYGTLWKVM
ncbi:DUF5916 domain-containing protein [Aequorivita capsosiphonis]|uniref:DUF5916 domain-containing protein n=1 Tax=Aequorivita capsosiphonis TaxID=487317 RepID=UPI00247FE8D7|nr:DUF5916 domain-containing protein [Aequorivita capsosiphonis]